VDLTLTKRADYVVRAAISLARASARGDFRKTREVAEEMGLPLRYTPQIMNLLVRAGLAEARAGQKGGYRLLRPPEQISLLELVETGEGSLRPDRCTLRGGPCRWQDLCPLHSTWEEAGREFAHVLESRSLASLAALDSLLETGGIPVPAGSHRKREPPRSTTRPAGD
jgi:Rrf2 family transcriptional regulator, iron-sulfur cluster assembly transcription factor